MKLVFNPITSSLDYVASNATDVGLTGLVTAITAGKTLTLTSTDDFNLTIPATGTAALLQVANVFTAKQTVTGTATSASLDTVSVTQNVTVPANQNTLHQGLIFQVNHSCVGFTNSGTVKGISGEAYQRTAGTIVTLGGMAATAGNYGVGGADHAGVITTVYGISSTVVNVASATLTNVFGLNLTLPTSGTVVTMTGINIAANTLAATSKYGIAIGNISGGATNNYSILTGTGAVKFGDAVTGVSFSATTGFIKSTGSGASFFNILGGTGASTGIGWRGYAIGSNYSLVGTVPTVDGSAGGYVKAYAIGFSVEDSTDKGMSFWSGTGAAATMVLRMTLENTGSLKGNSTGVSTADFLWAGDTATSLFIVDASSDSVDIGTTTQGNIAKFYPAEITFNEGGLATLDFRVESDNQASAIFLDSSADNLTINAAFQTAGGRIGKITTVTDTYTVLVTDETVICNKATNFTVTLPTAVVGQIFDISNINTGIVTVDGASTDTIDGDLTQQLLQWESMRLKCYIANKWKVQ